MEKLQHIRETTAAAALLQSQETAATRLLSSETLAALELLSSEAARAVEVRMLHIRFLSEAEDHRQLIGWMSGQYSVDTNISDNSAVSNFDIGALGLLTSQETKAIELKNAHKQVALDLNDFHRKQALELKDSQKLPFV